MENQGDAVRVLSTVRFMCSRLLFSSTQRSYVKKVIASEPIAMAGLLVKSSSRTYEKDELGKAIVDRVKHNIDVTWDEIYATSRLDSSIDWPQMLTKDALNRTTETVRKSSVPCNAITVVRSSSCSESISIASNMYATDAPKRRKDDVSLLQPQKLKISRTLGLRSPILRCRSGPKSLAPSRTSTHHFGILVSRIHASSSLSGECKCSV